MAVNVFLSNFLDSFGSTIFIKFSEHNKKKKKKHKSRPRRSYIRSMKGMKTQECANGKQSSKSIHQVSREPIWGNSYA